jgi:hypothetical protein
MANPVKEHEELLRRHRFVLVGENKHLKYKDPAGRVYIVSKTPSDWHAWQNALSTLKRVIANPVPTSEVIEEERQRKALEPTIQLTVTVKPPKGMQGAGKKAKRKGVGIFYDDDKRLKKEEERKRREIFLATEEGRAYTARKAQEEVERKQRRELRRLEQEWDRQLRQFRRTTKRWEQDSLDCRRFMVNSLMYAKSRQMFNSFLRKMREEDWTFTAVERQEGFRSMFIEVVRTAANYGSEPGKKLCDEIWEALEASEDMIAAIMYESGRAPQWAVAAPEADFAIRPPIRLLLRRTVEWLNEGHIVDGNGDGIAAKAPTPQWITDAVLALCNRRLKRIEIQAAA